MVVKRMLQTRARRIRGERQWGGGETGRRHFSPASLYHKLLLRIIVSIYITLHSFIHSFIKFLISSGRLTT